MLNITKQNKLAPLKFRSASKRIPASRKIARVGNTLQISTKSLRNSDLGLQTFTLFYWRDHHGYSAEAPFA